MFRWYMAILRYYQLCMFHFPINYTTAIDISKWISENWNMNISPSYIIEVWGKLLKGDN